ncbi:MAG: hypothetical protein QOH61_1897, partial [Chloroflexota bacterium]|nr:hypothetical protein [Chloroflexota bacterium]
MGEAVAPAVAMADGEGEGATPPLHAAKESADSRSAVAEKRGLFTRCLTGVRAV